MVIISNMAIMTVMAITSVMHVMAKLALMATNSLIVCVFIASPFRVGTLLMEVHGTTIGASFF